MEDSCFEGSTTSDSIFNSKTPTNLSLPIYTPAPSPKTPPGPGSLYRIGSGSSVVLDTADAGVCFSDQVESKKPPSSKYKGVVSQPNGRWGAQIYEKHHRVWLGTFTLEYDAGRAYDVAAQKFRGRDAFTNFTPLSDQNDAAAEISFLDSRSKAEVVDMLRKHTYLEELQRSKRRLRVNPTPNPFGSGRADRARAKLFEKTVTSSDVGKLNRLVIPKQHAEKHFPLMRRGTASKGLLLSFEDVREKVWRFRYSYWSSSQCYVLTKGWSRFVKENNLGAGDVVSFHRYAGPDKRLYIECRPKTATAMPMNSPASIRLFGVEIGRSRASEGYGDGGGRQEKRGRENVFDLLRSLESYNNKQKDGGRLS